MTVTTGENLEAAALAESLTSQTQSAPTQSDSVPVHVLQAMRDELRAEKEKNEAFRNHLQMMQWQERHAVQPIANPFQGKDPKDSILVEDATRLMSDFEQRTNAKLAEIKMASQSPDYKEIITKYLPKAAQEDPELLDDIKNSANPYKAAYLAAKASKAYQDDANSQFRNTMPKPKADPEMEKVINNSKQSGNLSSVGNQARLADKYPSFSNMTDEDFRKFKAQNLYGSRKK